jgi:hypothetical protein
VSTALASKPEVGNRRSEAIVQAFTFYARDLTTAFPSSLLPAPCSEIIQHSVLVLITSNIGLHE